MLKRCGSLIIYVCMYTLLAALENNGNLEFVLFNLSGFISVFFCLVAALENNGNLEFVLFNLSGFISGLFCLVKHLPHKIALE